MNLEVEAEVQRWYLCSAYWCKYIETTAMMMWSDTVKCVEQCSLSSQEDGDDIIL